MTCPRKRTLLMVLLLLTGGAIINVAVAWGCAVISTERNKWPPITLVTDPHDIRWISRLEHGPLRGISLFRTDGWGFERTTYLHEVGTIEGSTSFAEQIVAGWPTRGMGGGMWNSWPFEANVLKRQSVSHDTYVTAIPNPIQRMLWRHFSTKEWHTLLPCRPIWSGFTINTVFYAAILWLLVAAPFALRRRFVIRGRVRRGQCPACAYPVGSSTVCTECGKAVRIQKA